MADRTLYVLGAGFSKGFADIPVMDRFLQDAGPLLNQKKYQETRTFVEATGFDLPTANIETLLTLATMPKPWIAAEEVGRLAIVAEQLKALILDIIAECSPKSHGEVNHHPDRRENKRPKKPYTFTMDTSNKNSLDAFAEFLLNNHADCRVMSFNYDVLLENAIELAQVRTVPDSQFFHTGVSYGFQVSKVKPNGRIEPYARAPSPEDLVVLKMHGSLNWKSRRGHGPPFSVRDMVVLSCHDDHLEDSLSAVEAMDVELENAPFLVPPVTDKSSLMDHPVVTITWSRAGKEIDRADRLVFIGYSFPPTDFHAEFLFRKHGRNKPSCVVTVDQQDQKDRFEKRFKSILGEHVSFDYGGAVRFCEANFVD